MARSFVILFSLGALLVSTSDLFAQESADPAVVVESGTEGASPQAETPALATDSSQAKPTPGEDPKLKVGTFILVPSLTLSEKYDDNIYATRNYKVDDFITIVSPAIGVRSTWSKHKLNLYAGSDIGRYANESSEDYEDYWAGGDGRVDLSVNANLFGGGSYAQYHEERESPDQNFNAEEPTIYYETFGYLGGQGQFGKTSLRVGGTFKSLDFDDDMSATGEINNDDRDRNLYETGTRLGYLVAPGFEAFLQGAYDVRRYEASLDDAGEDRDSSGFGIATGLKMKLDDGLRLEVLAGYLHQDYEDSGLEDVSTPDFGARLNWKANRQTTVTGLIDRTVEETTSTGASSYVSTTLGAEVDYLLAPDVSLNADLYYSIEDYVGISRQDDLLEVGMGAAYYLTPYIWVGTDYRFLQRISDVAGEDYDDNQIFLRLGAKWDREYTDQDMAAYQSGVGSLTGLDGFYVGAQAGFGEVFTGIDGPRGGGGSLTADFGDHGGTAGLFAGYGRQFADWYLGFELEAEDSSADWDHAHLPGKRVFSVAKEETIGGSGRVGYFLPGGSLIYGRFGAVGTNFETRYKNANLSAVDNSMEMGIRFGGGIEVPFANGFFLRMDETYTSYADYDAGVGATTDNFSNAESLTRIGIGYRFGASSDPRKDEETTGNPLTGFYIGAQTGYGSLTTENTGPREQNSTLTADRGGFGVSGGLFGGYGVRLGDAYLAGEVDAELSDASWAMDRDPQRRAYSVTKDYSFGGSLIAGYVLEDVALVYGRVGVVRTGFDTDYTIGEDTTHSKDAQLGLRFGGGLEVPVSESISVRADYTYTDYDAYDVDYEGGSDRFENAESLFQVGIAYRF